jgi:hypothetical protein
VKSCWTAAPMTAEGPRKGEPSVRSMRNGFRTQPAPLVRGSSRRIMSLRFRPAYISVINRRASSWAVIGPAVHAESSRLTNRNVFPPQPPIETEARCQNGALRQGFAAPRRTPARRCLLRAVPAGPFYDGRLRREHFAVLSKLQHGKAGFHLTERARPVKYCNSFNGG